MSAVPVTLKAIEITHFSMKIFCVLHILKEAFRPITLGFHHSLFILYLLFNCKCHDVYFIFMSVYLFMGCVQVCKAMNACYMWRPEIKVRYISQIFSTSFLKMQSPDDHELQ